MQYEMIGFLLNDESDISRGKTFLFEDEFYFMLYDGNLRTVLFYFPYT